MPDFKLAILPVTQFDQNCTLLWEEDTLRAMVVDPGGDADEIFANIEKLGLKVELILLTHGHLDHVGGAMALKAMLGGAVPIHGPDIRDKFLTAELADILINVNRPSGKPLCKLCFSEGRKRLRHPFVCRQVIWVQP